MQRIIREEEPPKPSTRFSTSGEKLTIIAKHRNATPDRLHRVVRGDLDWITLKALEKDRSRRYESTASLAADINHYLADEPVLAYPPTPLYRLRKTARRYRGPLYIAAFVVLTLVGGIVGTSLGLLEASRARNEAILQREQADQQRDSA